LTRRTFASARSIDAPRHQRVAAPLVLLPVLVIMLSLAAILFVAMLIVAALIAASVAVSALFARRLRRLS
jgi:hypothetical protein